MFSDDSRPPIAQASRLLERGQLAEAEREAVAALAMFGRDCGEALFLLGLAQARRKNLKDAIALMAEAIQLLPKHAACRFAYGSAFILAGQPEQAIVQLEEAARLQPDMVDAWYALGGQQARLGRFAAAEQSYRRVLALAPGHGETCMALGACLLEQDRPQDAEPILREGLRGRPLPSAVAGLAQNLALAQARLGRHEDALASVALAERNNPRLKLHGLKGEIFASLHRFEEALEQMRAQIAATPTAEAVHKQYNDLLYLLGRDKEAEFLASYDRAPEDETLQAGKAGFLLLTRRDQEAHQLFARLLARNPSHVHAAMGTANALDRMGRHDEATRILDQALARNPGSPTLLNAMAATALLQRDPQKAAAMAQRAVAIDPFYQYALANLGTAWRLLGDERDELLNGYENFVRVFDLEAPEGFGDMESFNEALLAELESLHPATREFPDQSLRGGTQTRGSLFGTRHPLVERLRQRFDQTVRRYIDELQGDATHPLLARRAGDFSYKGSWSSRLGDCGFHVNHIHPEGWISSCYYVQVPTVARDEAARQGWIKFGEPGFGHGLGWRRALQPVPGRLVLFPSYMWHGTIAFQAPAARTTIAFDVVPGN